MADRLRPATLHSRLLPPTGVSAVVSTNYLLTYISSSISPPGEGQVPVRQPGMQAQLEQRHGTAAADGAAGAARYPQVRRRRQHGDGELGSSRQCMVSYLCARSSCTRVHMSPQAGLQPSPSLPVMHSCADLAPPSALPMPTQVQHHSAGAGLPAVRAGRVHAHVCR